MFKIDGLMLRKMFANMVQEKEIKTLQLFYKKMDEQKQLLKEFCKFLNNLIKTGFIL